MQCVCVWARIFRSCSLARSISQPSGTSIDAALHRNSTSLLKFYSSSRFFFLLFSARSLLSVSCRNNCRIAGWSETRSCSFLLSLSLSLLLRVVSQPAAIQWTPHLFYSERRICTEITRGGGEVRGPMPLSLAPLKWTVVSSFLQDYIQLISATALELEFPLLLFYSY